MSAAILSIGDDGIVALSAALKVVLLEVSRLFIETILVEHIVDNVVPVEKVGDGAVNVGGWVLGQVQWEVKGQAILRSLATGAVVALVGGSTIRVALR